MLDIGPHAGALVLYTDDDLAGAEIEIRPGGGPGRDPHRGARAPRRRPGAARGVFGSLAAGPYDLRLKGGGPGSFDLRVEVVAGNGHRGDGSLAQAPVSGPPARLAPAARAQ